MRERLAAAVLALFAATSTGLAQQSGGPTEAEVREVLETSAIESVLGSLGEQVRDALEQVAPSLGENARDSIGAAVVEAFAPDRLYPQVVAFVRSRSDQGQLATLRGWLLSESQRRIEAKSDPELLDESVEEYARRIQSSPPPEERIRLAARYVQVQRAGEFYVLLGHRVRTAARRLAEHVGGADAVVAEHSSAEDRARELQQYRMFSLVAFLQRMEPLSDEEARQLVEAYGSPSGQWYVETYTEALLSAIDAATAAAVARMRS